MSNSALSTPVFIVAPVRSGSNLLHLMLDAHSNISNPGECNCIFDLVTDEGNFPAMLDYCNWPSTRRIFQAKLLYVDENLSYENLIRPFLISFCEFLDVEFSAKVVSKDNQPDRYQGFKVVVGR